jgi:hypothetical protein
VKAHLPVAWLPRGTAEGTVLRLGLEIDQVGTRDGKARVQSLLDSMPNEP